MPNWLVPTSPRSDRRGVLYRGERLLRHGAFSRWVTGLLAGAIAAEQLAHPDCTLWLNEPSYAAAEQAWAEAACARLRQRRDELEEANADGLDDALTERP